MVIWKGHLAIGLIAFLAYQFLVHLIIKISDDPVFYALIAVVLGSFLPDILEPATKRHRKHRGICHSKRALKLIGKMFVVTALIGILGYLFIVYIFSIFYVTSYFFLGYALHLLADSTTHRLPEGGKMEKTFKSEKEYNKYKENKLYNRFKDLARVSVDGILEGFRIWRNREDIEYDTEDDIDDDIEYDVENDIY